MRIRSSFIAVMIALPVAVHAQDDSVRPPVPRITRRAPDRITLEEIQTVPDARDAYELVRLLRPTFLTERHAGSAGRSRPGQLMVLVNGAERVGVETLRTIPAHAVLEIRKLSASDAMTMFGKEQNGVIMVSVSTGTPPGS